MATTFHRPVFRPEPLRQPGAYKTYQIARPLPTHFRRASCAEADCSARARGWRTVVDVATQLGARQANYIRLKSGRAFIAAQAGTLVTFTFPPGQECFRQHRLPVGREPLFALAGGDWRGNPNGTRLVVFRGHRQFLDDFGEHQQRLTDRIKRG
jgi:hypothetical protein